MRCGITTTVRPGSGLTAWSWNNVSGRAARSEGRKRTRSLDWSHVAYWLALLACSSLFGLTVGGYAGFMEAATPHGGTPGSLAQLATSDGQGVAMMRQSRITSGGRLRSMAESLGVSAGHTERRWRIESEGSSHAPSLTWGGTGAHGNQVPAGVYVAVNASRPENKTKVVKSR